MNALSPEQVDTLASEVVSGGIGKIQIRLSEVDFTSEPPGRITVDVTASIAIAGRFQRTSEGDLGRIVLDVRYTLAAAEIADGDGVVDASDTAEEPASAWRCAVEMQGQWILVEPDVLTADHVRAFALRVGLMAIHPYARSHIQSLVAESGWALFTMDVLTDVDSIFESADDPSLLDLEGIDVEIDVEESTPA